MAKLEGVINSKSEIFFYTLLSFLLGIFVGNFFTVSPLIIFCLLLISAWGLFFCRLNSAQDQSLKRRAAVVVFLWLLFFFFGWWRFGISLPDYHHQENVYYYNEQAVEISGQIINIDRRLASQKLIIKSDALKLTATSPTKNFLAVKGKVLLTAPLYPEFSYGQKIEFSCYLKKPMPIEDFDYGRYLSAYGIYSLCYSEDVRILAAPPRSPKGLILFFKKKLSQSLNRSLSEPAAAILNGIILGDDKSIPEKLTQQFATLGLTHIIAVSGSHLAVISALFLTLCLLAGLSRPQAFWPASIGIIFYTILVGAPASAVRSAIMGIMLLYGQRIGRLNSARNALVFAAVLMLLVNPKLLLIDVGFQLSFAAVFGLVYLYPYLKIKAFKLPDWWQIKEIFLITLSAQIATLPLTAYYFGKISPLSLLANLLILPIIPLLMIWGMFNASIGLFSVTLGQIAGYFSWLLVAYWLAVTDFLAKLPWASINF